MNEEGRDRKAGEEYGEIKMRKERKMRKETKEKNIRESKRRIYKKQGEVGVKGRRRRERERGVC